MYIGMPFKQVVQDRSTVEHLKAAASSSGSALLFKRSECFSIFLQCPFSLPMAKWTLFSNLFSSNLVTF